MLQVLIEYNIKPDFIAVEKLVGGSHIHMHRIHMHTKPDFIAVEKLVGGLHVYVHVHAHIYVSL